VLALVFLAGIPKVAMDEAGVVLVVIGALLLVAAMLDRLAPPR
jgi:hypothetical protein